jgi:hypothetical protein
MNATTSDSILPAAIRDEQAEKKFMESLFDNTATPPIVGEMKAIIKNTSMHAVIKTIDIENTDKSNPLTKLTLQITAETRIAKQTVAGPAPFTLEQLQPGQRVTIVYEQTEKRTRALFITVTKE